jgi:hypothetical protein
MSSRFLMTLKSQSVGSDETLYVGSRLNERFLALNVHGIPNGLSRFRSLPFSFSLFIARGKKQKTENGTDKTCRPAENRHFRWLTADSQVSMRSRYQVTVTSVSLSPEYGGLRNRIGSNWADSASPKRGLHAGGEVVNFHGYEHKIEHATALGLGGARTPVCARFADLVRMRPDACLLAAVRGFG